MKIIDRLKRRVIGASFLFLLALSVALLTMNMTHHIGMKTTTEVKKQKIYSASPKANVLLYQEIGKDSDNFVLIYRDKQTDLKPTAHFIPDKKDIAKAARETANYKITNTKSAYLEVKTKKYVFANKVSKFLFDLGKNNDFEIKKKSTVYLPKDWLVQKAEQ